MSNKVLPLQPNTAITVEPAHIFNKLVALYHESEAGQKTLWTDFKKDVDNKTLFSSDNYLQVDNKGIIHLQQRYINLLERGKLHPKFPTVQRFTLRVMGFGFGVAPILQNVDVDAYDILDAFRLTAEVLKEQFLRPTLWERHFLQAVICEAYPIDQVISF